MTPLLGLCQQSSCLVLQSPEGSCGISIWHRSGGQLLDPSGQGGCCCNIAVIPRLCCGCNALCVSHIRTVPANSRTRFAQAADTDIIHGVMLQCSVAWHAAVTTQGGGIGVNNLCCAAVHSAAFAAARCTTASGIWANRATFSPKDALATPGVSLYRNVILQHAQPVLLQQPTLVFTQCKPAPTFLPGTNHDLMCRPEKLAAPGNVVGAICGCAPLRCNRALAADWLAARLLAAGLLLGVVFLLSSRHGKVQRSILHKCHVAACYKRWVLFLQHRHLQRGSP